MIIFRFFKKSIVLLTLSFLGNLVNAQNRGTSIYYVRSVGYGQRIMPTIDSANFKRVLPPYEKDDKIVEVKEFYLDGKIKSVTQCKTEYLDLKSGMGQYNGKRITFYPSGSRESICEYTDGIKNGMEYLYYENAKPHLVIKNRINYLYHHSDAKIVEFFDKSGGQICTEGNGQAIIYDADFKVLLKGPIKDGKMDGLWEGFSRDIDDVKYQLLYKNNVYQSGSSQELTTGKSYIFNDLYVAAHNEKDIVTFVSKLKKNLKAPKTLNVNIDSVQIYFEIETDGKVTNFSTIEPVSDDLMNALKIAIDQCPKWVPAKIYGIPLRTQIAVTLGIQKNTRFSYIQKTVENYQIPLYRGIPLGALPVVPRDFD
jgi:antitoxin component YwqK of YwqJK toxin-antitoxin module